MDGLASVCVFCGSSTGVLAAHADSATAMGAALGRARIRLVYGGGKVGLMGRLADAALAAGGEVTGVIPRFLMDREVGHLGLSDIRIVDSMHQRKATMADLSDAFAVLPGGIGTLEEFFEIWTWRQLDLHAKPLGLLNTEGYYDRLLGFLDDMMADGFLPPASRASLVVARNPEALLAALHAAAPAAPGRTRMEHT